MRYECLELWESATPEALPRSRLFNLPPKELESERREAQVSYLIRIAHAHCVRPMDLINREIIPLTNIRFEKSSGSFQTQYTKTVNAHAKYAREFVRALCSLTQRQEIELTTFIPWGDVLDPRGTGLLSPHPKWCQQCLTEWRESGEEPYFPLLWYAGPVKLCLLHSKLLVDACPDCGRHQPFIPKHTYLDHCSHCGAWLASRSNQVTGLEPTSETGSRYERFLASAIAEMIQVAPVAREFATYPKLQQQLKGYVQLMAGGVGNEFERLMGFKKTVLMQWINKNTRPQIGQFLLLCYRLRTTPVAFLRDEVPSVAPASEKSFTLHDARPRTRLTANARNSLQKQLQAILDDPNEFPTFKSVYQQLDYTKSFLKHWFPDLCLAISQKYRDHTAARTAAKRLADVKTAIQVVTLLLEQHRRINVRLIDGELNKLGLSMRNPDTRAAVRKAKQDFYSRGVETRSNEDGSCEGKAASPPGIGE